MRSSSSFPVVLPRKSAIDPTAIALRNPVTLMFLQPVLLNLYMVQSPRSGEWASIMLILLYVGVLGLPLAMFRAMIWMLAREVRKSQRTSTFHCSASSTKDKFPDNL